MKKFYLLTKTLLVAALLCVGASNAWADYGESTEGLNVTLTWDFAEYTTKIDATQKTSETYEGLLCYFNSNNSGDYITTDGFRCNGVATSTTRYIKYTPKYDGTINVYYKSNNGEANDRIVALSTAVTTGNSIQVGTGGVVAFGTTEGLTEKSFSGSVTAGTSYYIYNAYNGCTITKIEYTHKCYVTETYDFKTMIAAGYSSAKTSPSQSVTYYLYGQNTTTTETNCAKLNYLYDTSGNQYSIGSHIYMYAHEKNADLTNSNYWWIRTGSDYNYLYNNKTNQTQRIALVGLSKGDKFTITFGTGSLAFQTANVYSESDDTKTNVTASATVGDCTSVESGKTYVVSDDALGEDGSINVAMATKRAAVGISKIVIERTSVKETIDAPTFNVAYNGANRTVTIIDGVTNSLNSGVTTYYTTDGSTPTTSSSVYSAPLNISENCTVKAISIAVNGTVSLVASQEVTVGKLTVAAPTITFTRMETNSTYYSPVYTIANGDNSSIFGTPTPTLTATFNGEDVDVSSGTFKPSIAGTLIVTASAANYTSASTELSIYGAYSCKSTPNFNEIALTDLSTTLGGTWGDSYLDRWSEWTRKAGKNADLTDNDSGGDNNYAMSNLSGGSVEVGSWFTYTRNRGSSALVVVAGYGLGEKGYNSTMTINSPVNNAILEYSYGKNTPVTTYVTMTSSDESNGTWSRSMTSANALRYCKYYTPTDVDIAILDCKNYDSSSAFATAIEAESFASVEDVYAFNTSYHITNGVLTDGVRDITGVIRNAAIADGTDWDGATILNGEKYAGAPDEYYLDKNTGEIDASQTIYGLPAGVYVLKAATRAKAGTSGTIYVWDEANDHTTAINANGNTGGGLDNGWDWTEVEFTLTSTANVKIGFWADVDGYWASCDDFHMYKVESVNDVTVSAAGYATYVPSYDLNFTDTDIKAYKVKVSTKGKATMTQVNNVPAGTPVLLYYEGGKTEDIPVMTGAAAVTENDLVAGTGAAVPTSDSEGNTNMILNNVGGKIGFYFAAGQTVATNRAYLHIASTLAPDASESRMVMVFADDEATAVFDLNDNSEMINNNWYDLQGRRVDGSRLNSGIYIKNGKKVVVK